MINFDFLTLTAFLQENADFLLGSALQKIQQPTRQELMFSLRNKGQSRKFYVNISPRFFHLCFMGQENEKKRLIRIPSKPPMFCMLLRKYLEGARIAKISQPEGERILEFYFETYNEIGEKIYLCLAIELMGKHSNVVLYNYDTNVIIGCAHNVGSDKSRERELIGGLPYAYPPKGNNKSFIGLSEILFSKQNLDLKSRLGLLTQQQEFVNALKTDSCNDFIDTYFAELQAEAKFRETKAKLLTSVKTKLKKTNSALEKVQKQSKTHEKADLYRKKGDLIMANLFHNKDFSQFIEIMDYETNSPLKIELDETKTLKENANQFYKLYTKAKTANLKSQEIIENLQIEKEYLEQVLYSIEGAETVDELLEIEEEINVEAKSKKQKAKSDPSLPITIHHSPFTIYVGKNNKQNDYIVSKLARDEDLWFHVHNCAGSHVLLRVEAGQKVTDEILLECAKLAKQYSSAKLSSKVGVIYTKAKNLKKPTGAKLGYVIYKGEKEIIIN